MRSYRVKDCAVKECTVLASQNIPAGAGGKASVPGKRKVLPSSDPAAAAFTSPAHRARGAGARQGHLAGTSTACSTVYSLYTDRQLVTDEQPLIPNALC